MKTNGGIKTNPRTPIFTIGGQEFVILCGRFECDGHQTAITLGGNPRLVCKRNLTFTGETAPMLLTGTPSTLNGVCPILLF